MNHRAPPEKGNAARAGNPDGEYREDYKIYAENSKRNGLGVQEDSILRRPIPMTFFPNDRAFTKRDTEMTLVDLAEKIKRTTRESKQELPGVKLQRYGDRRTDRKCLRNTENVLASHGLEIDHDPKDGPTTIDEAADLFREQGVAVLLHSSASGRPDAWHALVPLSAEHTADDRTTEVEKVNALFDGEIDQHASFTTAQHAYFGSVEGGPPMRTILVDGRPIDTVEMPRLPKGKRSDGGHERDESGSGHLFRLARRMKAQGLGYLDFVIAAWEDEVCLRHLEKEGRAGRDRSTRAVERAWSRAPEPDEANADNFDHLGSADEERTKGARLVSFSDDHLAALVGKRCVNRLRFNETTGKWLSWQGDKWKPDATTDALTESRELCRSLANGDKRNVGLVSAGTINSVVNLARTERGLRTRQEEWDADPWMLGTPGGTVDLRTGEVRPARPDDLISRRTAIAPIPLDRFDPEEDCPEFLRFLAFACDDDRELVDYLVKWGGYALTGDTREQAFLFVYGTSGTGKSTLLNLFLWLLGDYGTHVDMGTLTQRRFDQHMQELARLEGARLVVSSETEANRSWAEARLKAITGGDPITANLMRENARTFLPVFKLMIAGNHRPALTAADPAIERRINIVGFDRPPARRDDGLMDRLKAEGPGILSLLIKGCLRWQREGLKRPKIVADAVRDYFAAEDTFAEWVDEECERGDDYAATTESLFDSWSWYARKAQAEPGSRNRTFPEEMRRLGFTPIKNRFGIRGRGFRGLRLQLDDHGLI